MSETEQEVTGEDPVEVQQVPEESPAVDGDEGDAEEAERVPDDEPDEEDAELEANAEREQELAAERQAEAQSLEAQQRDQDAKRKKLDQLAGHVARRYGEILGPDLDGWVGCPLCAQGYPGIRLPVMPDYETVAAVKVAIGEDPDPPLAYDHYSRECEDCAGLGKVLTGSKVSGQQTAQCIPCKGRGWMSIGPERESGSILAGAMPDNIVSTVPLVANGDEPPEAAALKALGYIVVPPMTSPEIVAAQGG